MIIHKFEMDEKEISPDQSHAYIVLHFTTDNGRELHADVRIAAQDEGIAIDVWDTIGGGDSVLETGVSYDDFYTKEEAQEEDDNR